MIRKLSSGEYRLDSRKLDPKTARCNTSSVARFGEGSMRYEGSCHCGRIAFTVEGDLTGAAACNCSLCRRKGALMWFVPRTALELTTSESTLSTYLFNKERIRHYFCDRCGIHPFGEGIDPNGNAMAAVNARCLDGVDLDALTIRQFDGARL